MTRPATCSPEADTAARAVLRAAKELEWAETCLRDMDAAALAAKARRMWRACERLRAEIDQLAPDATGTPPGC